MIGLIGIFVITSSATIMNGLDINFTTKTVSTPQNIPRIFGINDDAKVNCSVCGERMKIRNPGLSCLVYHPDGKCGWHDPYCPNEQNHNKKMISIETIEKFVRVSTSSDVSAGEIARPVCDWIGHQWMEINDFIKRGEIIIIDDRYETQRCLYCNKRRIKKEVWEDVK